MTGIYFHSHLSRRFSRREGLKKTLCAALCTLYVVCSFLGGHALAAPGAHIPVPKGLATGVSAEDAPEHILSAFLGIPYRSDGVIDAQGRYTLFARQEAIQNMPGLNCSGYVIAAFRFLVNRNIPLSEVGVDRLGDSGPDSPYGHDWDLGWDLVLNLSEGMPRQFLLPGYETLAPEDATGFGPRGFDLHAPETWQELPGRLRPGYVYLLSFSKETREKGYTLKHYHVGIIHVDDAGRQWFYNTTTGAKKSYRRDFSSPKDRAAFLKAFANTGSVRKYIAVLEVKLR